METAFLGWLTPLVILQEAGRPFPGFSMLLSRWSKADFQPVAQKNLLACRWRCLVYPSLQLSPLKVRQCENSKANFQAVLNVAKKESQESRMTRLPAACFLADSSLGSVLLQQAKLDLFIPRLPPQLVLQWKCMNCSFLTNVNGAGRPLPSFI